jgi:hypothetical protein
VTTHTHAFVYWNSVRRLVDCDCGDSISAAALVAAAPEMRHAETGYNTARLRRLLRGVWESSNELVWPAALRYDVARELNLREEGGLLYDPTDAEEVENT